MRKPSTGPRAQTAIFGTSRNLQSNAPVKVLKFGGSSVGSADAFRNTADVLVHQKQEGNNVVGVLSAMFGVTNRLVEAGEAAAEGNHTTVSAARQHVVDLHVETVADLFADDAGKRAEALAFLESCLQENFDGVVASVEDAGHCSAEHMDQISSLGERLSNHMMALYLEHRGFNSTAVQADEVIVTCETSGNATPELSASADKIRAVVAPMMSDANGIPLVTGFIGSSPSGKVTTLGRGGSDLSAAVVGYALDADEVGLYKVEYTTKANGTMDQWESGWIGIVHDNNPLDTLQEISYEEAAELAHFGKKVLHPETVSPAVKKSIPIRVGNTLDYTHPGTIIRGLTTNDSVNAVTSCSLAEYEQKKQTTIEVPSEMPFNKEDASLVAMVGQNVSADLNSDMIEGALARAGIIGVVPEHVNGSSHSGTVVVNTLVKKAALAALHEEFVDVPVKQMMSQ